MIAYSGYIYSAAANESFDSVALAIYGDEKYARELMLANPELSGQFVFEGSEVLKLPQIEIPTSNSEAALANTIAPWKA